MSLPKAGAEFVFGITGDYLKRTKPAGSLPLSATTIKRNISALSENGIILAAGDFPATRRWSWICWANMPPLTENGEKFPYIPAGRKGKGVQMGLWAGGKMEPGPRGGMWCCVGGSGGPMDGQCLPAPQQARRALHQRGHYGLPKAGLPGARQPKGAIYTVNWREELEYQTLDHTAIDMADTRLWIALKCSAKAQRMGTTTATASRAPPLPLGASQYTGLRRHHIPELAERLGLTGEDKENFISSLA